MYSPSPKRKQFDTCGLNFAPLPGEIQIPHLRKGLPQIKFVEGGTQQIVRCPGLLGGEGRGGDVVPIYDQRSTLDPDIMTAP